MVAVALIIAAATYNAVQTYRATGSVGDAISAGTQSLVMGLASLAVLGPALHAVWNATGGVATLARVALAGYSVYGIVQDARSGNIAGLVFAGAAAMLAIAGAAYDRRNAGNGMTAAKNLDINEGSQRDKPGGELFDDAKNLDATQRAEVIERGKARLAESNRGLFKGSGVSANDVQIRVTEDVKFAGVRFDTDHYEMRLNPRVFRLRSEEDIFSVFAHEYKHVELSARGFGAGSGHPAAYRYELQLYQDNVLRQTGAFRRDILFNKIPGSR